MNVVKVLYECPSFKIYGKIFSRIGFLMI